MSVLRMVCAAGLLTCSGCGSDEANVLITRIVRLENGERAALQLDCVTPELERGDPPNVVLTLDALWVERSIADGAVSVKVAAGDEVLANRNYDAAFVDDGESDRFEVTTQGRRYELTFWAAGTCAAPAPGEAGRVREPPVRPDNPMSVRAPR